MGTYHPKAEPEMVTIDWRAQLLPHVRGGIVHRVMVTLHKHLPFSGEEGINQLRRIATRFEEKILSTAVDQNDYYRKISAKLLTIESKSQTTAAASLTSLPAAYIHTPLEPGHMMENNNWGPSLPEQEPAINTNDWRTQLPPDARHKVVNKLMETLKKHLAFSGPAGINELRKIAAKVEEKVFEAAVDQTDYLRKISMKVQIMEATSQNSARSSLSQGDHRENVNSMPCIPKEQPVVNTNDWRIQLPLDVRHKNANKIMETVMKHFPNSGEEGIKMLKRIALDFENLFFKTAINQMDYFRKIYFKMEMMEESDSRPQKKIKIENH